MWRGARTNLVQILSTSGKGGFGIPAETTAGLAHGDSVGTTETGDRPLMAFLLYFFRPPHLEKTLLNGFLI